MNKQTQVISLIVMLSITASAAKAESDLYLQFQNPPKEYGLMPYWFWNGNIAAEGIRQQLTAMHEQGVHSAIVFPWDGMEVPYLSEDWWDLLGVALETAAGFDFTLNLNDEFTWPSGHAWDHYQQGPDLSRVLQNHPEYRMKQLVSEEIVLTASSPWQRSCDPAFEYAVIGRLDGQNELMADTLKILDPENNRLSWKGANDSWKIHIYSRKETIGAHNMRVDLLNPDAVREYIRLYYEPLARRYERYFGGTLKMTTADHEGTYGVHPVWTPGLWEKFRTKFGYDLRTYVPLLKVENNSRARKVRADYFQLVSELYRTSFLGPITQWCEDRGLQHTASFYEEQLYFQIDLAGDMFGLWRTTSAVEIDALLERSRMPIDFKEAVSVAHFERKKLIVENQGLQGSDSFLSPEKMKSGSAMALLWGANTLVPYFDYDPQKIQWPPQWFQGQPFWRYFHCYADFVRRVSFMNSRGRHIAPIAIYYPLESAWANSTLLFDREHQDHQLWKNEMDRVEAYYTALRLELSRQGWDYHILDSHYLQQAEVRDAALRLADESFRILLLPPLTAIHTSTMEKIKQFYERGGTVIAMLQLPESSLERGDDDPAVVQIVQSLFGDEALQGNTTVRTNSNQGNAYFFPCGRYENFMKKLDYTRQIEVPVPYQQELRPILATIENHIRREAEVIEGDAQGLYVTHRIDGKQHFYFVVNDTENTKQITLRLNAAGQAQRWDPYTGTRNLLSAKQTENGTEVKVEVDPWSALYVVISDTEETLNTIPSLTEIQTIDLSNNPWTLSAVEPEVTLPYAEIILEEKGEGETKGRHLPDADTSSWTEEWLAKERRAQVSWWLLGPFPYNDHQGYNEVNPPEKGIVDLTQKYVGTNGKPIRWEYKTSPTYWVNVRELLDIPSESVAYAYSDVYSPVEREGEIRVAFADSIKVWWNEQSVMAVHRHPKWMLLRDPWAETAPIRIQRGWNRVLLKICRSENRPISFLFRIADSNGNTIDDLVYARSNQEIQPETEHLKEKWYRVVAPPGTRNVVVPKFKNLLRTYIDGIQRDVSPGETVMLSPERVQTIVFVCHAGEQWDEPIRFLNGYTAYHLGSWNECSLVNYSGAMAYRTEFTLESIAAGESFQLDCGTVGLTAEVWLNNRKVGDRIWRPYRFDVTDYVQPGRNMLKIFVTNSDANRLCQGDPIYPRGSWGLNMTSERDRLKRIDPNGLIGPVQLKRLK